MNKTVAQQVNERAAKSNTPLNAVIELTYRCNQHCIFCYQSNRIPGRELSSGQWCDILDQLASAGTLYLTFTGGEPFLYPSILDILAHSRRKAFAVSIITNGILINKTIAARLKDLHVMDVGISLLASNAPAHDSLTGIPGAFNRAIEAIRLLVGNGMKVLVKHTVTSANFGEYKGVAELAESEGCLFECDTMVVPAQPESISPYALSSQQIRIFINEMGMAAGAETCEPNPGEGKSWRLHCDAGRSVCGITPSGDLLPCIQLPITLGNLTSGRLDVLWSCEKASSFREYESHISAECGSCAVSSYCSRCHGIAFHEAGEFIGSSPSLCRHAEVIRELKMKS